MVFGLAFRKVFIVMLSSVWHVSPEIKQLECRSHGRQCPVNQHVGFGESQNQQIESNRHEQNLPKVDVLLSETQIPNPEVPTRMEIWVAIGCHKPVVEMVLFEKISVKVEGK